MNTPPGTSALTALFKRLHEADDTAQDARNNNDQQALGYAEGESLRMKREIAKLDPRGYGYNYLNLLTSAERAQALQPKEIK